jgi:hypothetical protein
MRVVEEDENDGAGGRRIKNGLSFATGVTLRDKTDEEKRVILKLMPESIRSILPNGCDWALNALPTEGGRFRNKTTNGDENINSWETQEGLQPQEPTTDDCLVWAELGDNSRIHNANNNENVILGGGFLQGEGKQKVSQASEMNKAMFKGLKYAMYENT